MCTNKMQSFNNLLSIESKINTFIIHVNIKYVQIFVLLVQVRKSQNYASQPDKLEQNIGNFK